MHPQIWLDGLDVLRSWYIEEVFLHLLLKMSNFKSLVRFLTLHLDFFFEIDENSVHFTSTMHMHLWYTCRVFFQCAFKVFLYHSFYFFILFIYFFIQTESHKNYNHPHQFTQSLPQLLIFCFYGYSKTSELVYCPSVMPNRTFFKQIKV